MKHDNFTSISYFSKVKIVRQNIGNALLKAAKQHARGNLIDIGCGTKPYETLFAPFIKSYFGVDHPVTAEVNYGGQTKADLYADCTDTKLESSTFDTLLSTQVMEHIFDTKKYVSECYRLLKKGGIGIFTIPFLWQSHAEPYDFYRFTKYSIEQHFKEQDFEIIDLRNLEGAYAALIQTKIISLYSMPSKFIVVKIFQKFLQILWIPILNFFALHFDAMFYNDKLCLTYIVIVKNSNKLIFN